MSHDEYSRDTFDRAERAEDLAVEQMSEEIQKIAPRRLNQFPYRDLASQEIYYEPAQRKYDLLGQAEQQAYALEQKHRALVTAAEEAQKALTDFETNELDMHQGK